MHSQEHTVLVQVDGCSFDYKLLATTTLQCSSMDSHTAHSDFSALRVQASTGEQRQSILVGVDAYFPLKQAQSVEKD